MVEISVTPETDPIAEELITTRLRLYAALAEARTLRIQMDYLRAELIEARAELKPYAESRIEAVV